MNYSNHLIPFPPHPPATPADVGLLMQLGVDGVFVGSGIFKSSDPAKRARAMVQAVTHYNDPKVLAEVSTNLGEAMVHSQSAIQCVSQNALAHIINMPYLQDYNIIVQPFSQHGI